MAIVVYSATQRLTLELNVFAQDGQLSIGYTLLRFCTEPQILGEGVEFGVEHGATQ